MNAACKHAATRIKHRERFRERGGGREISDGESEREREREGLAPSKERGYVERGGGRAKECTVDYQFVILVNYSELIWAFFGQRAPTHSGRNRPTVSLSSP